MWLWQVREKTPYFRVARFPASPFFEIDESDFSSINAALRFRDIFDAFSPSLKLGEKEDLDNIILRYLADLDVALGVDILELERRKLEEEIKAGLWGEAPKNDFQILAAPDQYILTLALAERFRQGRLNPERILKAWFPKVQIWFREKSGEWIFSLPYDPTPINLAKINLIQDFFLPFKQKTLVFWRATPCLLDLPEASLDFSFLS